MWRATLLLLGRTHLTLEGVAVFTMPSIYGEKNAMCIALNENVTKKLEYLNFALIVPKSSISNICFVDSLLYEGEGSQNRVVVEALLFYSIF